MRRQLILIVFATVVLVGVSVTMMLSSGKDTPGVPLSKLEVPPKRTEKGVLDLICELYLESEGQTQLGIKGGEPPRATIVRIDFDNKSGWYQGKISISETRPGVLSVSGARLVFSRPALFQRFGTTVTRETVSIDRDTGSFEQTLTLESDKTVRLISGTCAKWTKAPF